MGQPKVIDTNNYLLGGRSFGPFVSDYTRYLPVRTNGRRLFWAIYAGNVLATFFSCVSESGSGTSYTSPKAKK